MATIHPFRALRPPVERIAEVASPPYDVVNKKKRENWRKATVKFLSCLAARDRSS